VIVVASRATSGQSALVRYEELPPISRVDFEAAFDTRSSEQQATAILRLALHDGDPLYIEHACIKVLDEDDVVARRAAIIAAGHLARLHGHVDLETQTRIRSLEADPELAGAVADALEDIAMFVRS
jgi:hypothetical protein